MRAFFLVVGVFLLLLSLGQETPRFSEIPANCGNLLTVEDESTLADVELLKLRWVIYKLGLCKARIEITLLDDMPSPPRADYIGIMRPTCRDGEMWGARIVILIGNPEQTKFYSYRSRSVVYLPTGWLPTVVLLHELYHVRQGFSRTYDFCDFQQRNEIAKQAEIEADDWTLSNYRRFGRIAYYTGGR